MSAQVTMIVRDISVVLCDKNFTLIVAPDIEPPIMADICQKRPPRKEQFVIINIILRKSRHRFLLLCPSVQVMIMSYLIFE